MKRKVTVWTFSGLPIAAIMVGVLGFSSVGSTNQKASTVSTQSDAVRSAPSTDIGNKNGEYQTVRVFWPIWNGSR